MISKNSLGAHLIVPLVLSAACGFTWAGVGLGIESIAHFILSTNCMEKIYGKLNSEICDTARQMRRQQQQQRRRRRMWRLKRHTWP